MNKKRGHCIMKQGDNGNIKVTFRDCYIYQLSSNLYDLSLLYHCRIAFCLYNITALYNSAYIQSASQGRPIRF